MAVLITIAEFCEIYGVSRSTAYRLINDGTLPLVKIGRASRIRSSDAEAWAKNLPEFNPDKAA